MNKAIVIGAGIHGITAAIALRDAGYSVTILEKGSRIFGGTSSATHTRAHRGYHYPRSIETAKECLKGCEFFEQKYPGVVNYPSENIYLIEKESAVSLNEYLNFCEEVGLGYATTDRYNNEHIVGGIYVKEGIYDVDRLGLILTQEILDKGIGVRLNTEVLTGSTPNLIKTNKGDIEADLVVNATYAYASETIKRLGLENPPKYKVEYTEGFIVKYPGYIPPLTVMDGKFLTIFPFVNEGQYLIYDIEHSYPLTPDAPSAWEKVYEHGQKYFDFWKELKYIRSVHGTRPLVNPQNRATGICHHGGTNVYSILEGKFISAPLIADQLVNKIITKS